MKNLLFSFALLGVLVIVAPMQAFAADGEVYRAADVSEVPAAGGTVVSDEPAAPSPQQPADPSKGVVAGVAKPIADGTYLIANAANSKVVLDDPEAKTASKVQMELFSKNKSNAQRFYIRGEGHGLVSIQSVASGLFLGDSSGAVRQLPQSSARNRLWRPVWSGGYVFVNAATGKVLSVAGNKAKSRAKVVTHVEKGAKSQRWRLSKTSLIANGYYQVRSAKGTNLDVTRGSCAYDANVQAFERNSGGAQVFHIVHQANGCYRIENAKSFLVVGVRGASKAKRANVVQQQNTGGSSQLWKPVLGRSGNMAFKNKKSGKVLEVASGESGANVRQNAANGSKRQGWKLKAVAKYSLSGNSTLDRRVASVLRTHNSLSSAFWWTVHHSYRGGARYWSGPRVLSDSTTIDLANDFLAHGSGNCYRFAATFSWLARGLGYKTNVISGWVQAAGGGRAPHGWVEVYSGGTYVCDPDLAHEIPGHNWFMCTYGSSPTAYYNW